jgi:hypothetical protein
MTTTSDFVGISHHGYAHSTQIHGLLLPTIAIMPGYKYAYVSRAKKKLL